MAQHTFFLCLGGTGSQVGTAIGAIYPILKSSGIADSSDVYKMFIVDKDTRGKNYDYCMNVAKRYKEVYKTLPFEALQPYEVNGSLYQEWQEAAGHLSQDYTVMDLIGFDSSIKELANMCWKDEKQKESLRDGNNRDPSRGSLDAYVSLHYFESSSLFKELKKLVETTPIEDIRIVILAGTTGGMGSSLIVPLVKRIKEYTDADDPEHKKVFEALRIDLVLLGTYFQIPQNPDAKKKVDEIGKTIDSYYRTCDQLKELEEGVIKKFYKQDWWVYYVAFPGFDDICGSFNKNGAEKRKAHMVELFAALAAFNLAKLKEPGFYQTTIPFDENGKFKIGWTDVPLGRELKKSIRSFVKCISLVACQLYPRLSMDVYAQNKDVYITKYIRKPKNSIGELSELASLTKQWLVSMIPYFEFWAEVQHHSQFGGEGKARIDFFKESDVEELKKILISVVNNPFASWGSNSTPINKMPMCDGTWMSYISDIKPDKYKLNAVLGSQDGRGELFTLMLQNLYNMLMTRKED